MGRRVVISGLGVITPIGIGKNKFWNSTIKGKSELFKIDDPELSGLKFLKACLVKEFDFRNGAMMVEVTDCLWLRSPRMKALPEEGCLMICKGACEKSFEGQRTRLILDPGLPEATCELRFYVDD